MQSRELIEILKICLDLRINEIARELNVDRTTIWKWLKGIKPRSKHHIELLKKLIELNRLKVKHELKRLRLIKREIEKINEKDWSNLIRGILFHFKMTQKQLGRVLRVQQNEISKMHNQKRKMLLKHKVRLLSFVNEKRKITKELIELGKTVNNSILVDSCLVNKKNSKLRSEMAGSLFIIKNNRLFLNTPLLFPSKFHRNEIKFILDQDNAIVFWENKFGEPFPLRLPKLIEINDIFLLGLGVFIAEGTKTKRKPKITNSEPVIIQQGIRFFEHIGINKKKLSGWIQVHERSPCKDENKLKRFWSGVSGLNVDQITTVWIKPDISKVKKVSVKEMGTFHLECNLILSRLLVDGLLSNVEIIVKNVPNSELFLLKGIVAGEGWCGQTKQGVVNELTITFKEKRWRKLTLDLLSKIGIAAEENERDSDISICGFKNFNKLHEVDIFQFHPEMRRKLADGLLLLIQSHIPDRNKERMIELLNRSETPLTGEEISKLLNLNRSNVNKHLLELFRANKISRKEGSGSIPHKWFIVNSNYFSQCCNGLSSFFDSPSCIS